VNDCMAVRERLTEWAVSTLPEQERREVDRHLEWCAGCRKEASELRAGAALVGLSAAQQEPPPSLEDRVVTAVRGAVTKAPSRSRRLRNGAVLLVAVLGLLALGGGLRAWQQSNAQKLHLSEEQAKAFSTRLERVLQDFRGPTQSNDMSRATLGPVGGKTGGGGAIRVISPHFEDMVVVVVGALPENRAPYRVWLVSLSGHRWSVGTIPHLTTGGGGTAYRESSGDLRLYHYVQVRDARGRLVLAGGFPQP
jgi:hypothetical protein